MKKLLVCLLALMLTAGILAGCGKTEMPEKETEAVTTTAAAETATAEPAGLWKDALYTADTVLGEGEKALTLEVTAQDTTVTFTVNTDAETVGEALLGVNLIEGEQGAYGLYVKKVNGITADYDTDGAYWCFNINGEMAMTGVDGAELTGGDTYQLVYTK